MTRIWRGVAALLGAGGVAAGAIGAHLVSDPALVTLMNTATSLALPHAAALLGLALLAERAPRQKLVTAAGWLLSCGALLFCFALWGHGLWGRSLGPVAPTGGVILILGWLVLLASAIQRPARG